MKPKLKGNCSVVGVTSPLYSEPRNCLVNWRVGQNGGARGGILPLSDRWSLANAVRKIEFKLLQISSSRRDPILASQCAKMTFGKVLLRFEPR
jgi:hypothetical protein